MTITRYIIDVDVYTQDPPADEQIDRITTALERLIRDNRVRGGGGGGAIVRTVRASWSDLDSLEEETEVGSP